MRHILLALILVVTLAACSGDPGERTVSAGSVAAATESANSARFRIEVEHANPELSAVATGVMSFRTGDSEITTKSAESESGARGSVTRTVGKETFLGTTAEVKSGPAWVRMTVPEAASEGATGLGLNPASIAEELKQSATEIRKTGADDVRGDRTTTYTLDFRAGTNLLVLMMTPANAAATATMDVDEEGRLRRLVVEPDSPSTPGGDDKDFPVPKRSTLELWDFGVGVDVHKPEEADVVDFDDPDAGELLAQIFDDAGLGSGLADGVPPPDDIKLAGPFSRIAGGTWENVTWEVWEAPTTDGRVCQTFELDPPPTDEDFGMSFGDEIAHEGEPASCSPRADLFEESDPVQLLGSWFADAKYWYLAGTTASEITALEVELTSGRVINLAVDPQSHVFALFNRSPLKVKEVRAIGKGSIRCRPEEEDGAITFLNCSGTVG